jgi:hypothetical protein
MGRPLQQTKYTKGLEEKTKAIHKAMPGTSPVYTGISKMVARLAGYDPENESRRELDKNK